MCIKNVSFIYHLERGEGQKVEGFTTSSTQDVAEWVKWMTGVYCYPYSLLKLFSCPRHEQFLQRREWKKVSDKEMSTVKSGE